MITITFTVKARRASAQALTEIVDFLMDAGSGNVSEVQVDTTPTFRGVKCAWSVTARTEAAAYAAMDVVKSCVAPIAA